MINSTFKFIGKNPPSLLIMGGILMMIIGAANASITSVSTNQLLQFGPVLIGIGVVLNILWLLPRFLKR